MTYKNEDLKKLYDEFNRLYFNEKLPENAKLEWSTKMTRSAGICYRHKDGKVPPTIRLSVYYHEKHPEDILNTLLHEMIHILHPNHGNGFYKELQRLQSIGLDVTRFSKERALTETKWEYHCSGCGIIHKRQRRIKNGGKFHRCKCGGELKEVQKR